MRDYLFESRFFRVHRPRGIPGRELKYDRPADLHRFSPHTWRQLGDDRCYHSRWYLRETDGPSSSSSLIDLDFLPCAKRDINTFYLYLRTNDCEKKERERKEVNFKASGSMIYIYIYKICVKLNWILCRVNVIRDIVIYLTLICLKIGGNNNGIKKSKLRVNKRTIARF